MTKSRMTAIRRYIKAGEYFKVLGKQLDIIQQETGNPARKKRNKKIVMNLRGDMSYLQKNYRVVKRT